MRMRSFSDSMAWKLNGFWFQEKVSPANIMKRNCYCNTGTSNLKLQTSPAGGITIMINGKGKKFSQYSENPKCENIILASCYGPPTFQHDCRPSWQKRFWKYDSDVRKLWRAIFTWNFTWNFKWNFKWKYTMYVTFASKCWRWPVLLEHSARAQHVREIAREIET